MNLLNLLVQYPEKKIEDMPLGSLHQLHPGRTLPAMAAEDVKDENDPLNRFTNFKGQFNIMDMQAAFNSLAPFVQEYVYHQSWKELRQLQIEAVQGIHVERQGRVDHHWPVPVVINTSLSLNINAWTASICSWRSSFQD